MNSFFRDISYKVFKSGDPVYLYIGINAFIFIAMGLVSVILFLSGQQAGFQDQVFAYVGFPADLNKLPFRFYTLLTYQFFHEGLLHILFNMLWLFWMGRIFLDFLKARQFHFVYLGGGFAGALVYLLAFNIFPVFMGSVSNGFVIGSSAAVMAIIVGTATLLPDYSMRLLLFGDVKLKYLAAGYVVLDMISLASANAGGSFAHLGGGLFGFVFIRMLRAGTDWSSMFKRKPKLRVVHKDAKVRSQKSQTQEVDQRQIDAILDKISQSGYDKLSKEEKEILFKASKH
ncbi:rhomboid family intramembrane serine protease [Pedobacter deserti]|uniref:rhomboid family intramembrane serine protease n=1 Tax=Pedobacter deserti TaxID=2817382 RepID=UPI002109957A|nr:rhomboid family intramembrane serine protease [Pedobacter sp. SYSU D00382]